MHERLSARGGSIQQQLRSYGKRATAGWLSSRDSIKMLIDETLVGHLCSHWGFLAGAGDGNLQKRD